VVERTLAWLNRFRRLTIRYELLSKVVYGVMAHPFGLLSRLLVFGRFEAVHKAGAMDNFGQLFGPV
jgi:hypothetical protein